MRSVRSEFMPSLQAGPPAEILSLAARRGDASASLVAQAHEMVRAGHAMAARFHRRGRLVAFGAGPASADAQHLAAEFLHPGIAGKRALPAVSLVGDVAGLTGAGEREAWPEVFASPLRQLARPADIALAISIRREPECVRKALQVARDRGLLTVSVVGEAEGPSVRVDHRIGVGVGDPLVAREMQLTACHLIWELVHAFLERPSTLAGAES